MQMWIDRLHSLVSPSSYIPTYMAAPSAATLASLPLNVGNLREPSAGWADPAWAAAGFLNSITSYQPQGWSFYNGLDLQMQRRFARGLDGLRAMFLHELAQVIFRVAPHFRCAEIFFRMLRVVQ